MKKKVKKALKHSYTRFATISLIVFLLVWATTIFLTERYEWNHNLAYVCSLFVGSIILFVLHEKITFKVTYSPRKVMFKKFIKLYTIAYILNWILVYFASSEISYILAIPLVTFILSLLLYKINKRWIFQNY
jgi:putative flippase GtrA